MSLEILTPIHQLLRGQQLLPEHLRQNTLLLRFDPASPARASLLADFYRIQLTPELKAPGLGEDTFYRADLYQPSRSNSRLKICRTCGQAQTAATPQYWKCTNRKCRQHGRLVHSGPVRGVVDVRCCDQWVVSRETVPITLNGCTTDIHGVPLTNEIVKVKACLLVLDRRYGDIVLAAVYRTAGMICDQYGWKLL